MRNMILSASKLDTVALCLYKFNLEVMMNLQPKEMQQDSPMEKGSLMHKMLETYYREKAKAAVTPEMIQECMNQGRYYAATKLRTLQDATVEDIVRVFRDYCLYYQNEMYVTDILDNGEPAVETPFAKVLHEENDLRIIVEGTVDWMVEIQSANGQKVIVDHKTGNLPLRLSNQFMCYPWVTERRTVIVNSIQLKDKDTEDAKRFRRVPYTYSDQEIQEWKRSVIYYAKKIDEAVRDKYFPRDFTSCKKYGLCQFYPICDQDIPYRYAAIENEFIVAEPYDKDRFKGKEVIIIGKDIE